MAIEYDPSENPSTGIPFSNGQEEAGLINKKSEGGAFTNESVGEYVTARSAANDAQTSANYAAISETAAAVSATQAQTFAVNASNSASDAQDAALNAGIAEANAITAQNASETSQELAEAARSAAETALIGAEAAQEDAIAKALAASLSESNAATSESNAATSAANAAASEENAATSESNAATSASNASTSETNASTSESNAAASATAAALSATSAALSEINAQASASFAASSATSASLSEAAAQSSEDDAETAQLAAEAAQLSAETAETAAETAQTAAETAQTASETAQTAAEAAQASATASANSATASATSAAGSASTAASEATDAATEATAAAASASAASSSASAAATSATASATSATQSATSATASATSATASAASATASATSASESEASATDSETSAISSAASASDSATSASESAASATASATSATQSATSATASATSATQSETSANNAATSETNAATSETNAATSETNAGNSATAAASSASAAATSETNAATSETNAATSETNAGISETNASTSETNAASSASAAASSATAAASSASAASTSETNAAASESAAATSESNASTSETNAANSASAASASASAASTSETNAAASEAASEAVQEALYGIYLGIATEDPTVDLNGNALDGGEFYYNTTSSVTRVYNGSFWVNGAVDTSSFILTNGDGQLNTLTIGQGDDGEGVLAWDESKETITITLGNGVVQQVGEEVYYPKNTRNMTGSTIPNGTPVMLVGGAGDDSYIAPASASSVYDPEFYIGLTTEDIVDGAYGRITYFGSINDVDTSAFSKGQLLYVSTTAGQLTTTRPVSPNHTILAALVTKSDATTGRLFVRTHINPDSEVISYDNSSSGLVASNVQAAIDELQDTKADVSLLSSNIILYPTTAASDVTGYNRMVTDLSDSDYDATAVDVSTGTISTDDQLVGALIADAGLFTGNPGVISIPTVGNIAKTSGNNEQYAGFYFTVSKRDSVGTETLIATSSSTGAINPQDTDYRQFSASALFSNGDWVETDRVVIKYYAELLGNTGSAYNFQFGGSSPVYTNLPVPVSVIPSDVAEDILVDTTNFSGVLSGTDSNVQTALETIDGLSLTIGGITGLQDELNQLDSDITAAIATAASDATTKANTAESNANAYTDSAVSGLVDAAPTTLDTLNELAAALGDDPNFATTVTASIGTKAAKTTTISAGTALTGGGDLSANRTISHGNVTRSNTTGSGTLSHSGTFTAITGLTSNAQGHVTGAETTTYTLPAGAVPNNATITVAAGTDLATGGDFTTDQGTNETITINHANISRTDTTSTASPTHGGTVSVVNSVSTNARGHVTGIDVKTITLPADNNTWRPIHDTPVDGATTTSISSNWAFDNVKTAVPSGAVFTDTVYSHPTHPGDDFSVDTGPLTGATVVSDIDINVTTDTLGHVTDANGVVSTRTLTLADLGFTGASNANYYTLPEATSTVRGGIELFSDTDQTVAANAVSSTAGRTYGVQLNSAGQAVVNVPWVDTNTVYTHPSHPGDDINLDTGPLTGATVISDLDFNVTTDTLGHVTDANATYSTRNLTYSDVGAAAASHSHSYLPLSGGTVTGTITATNIIATSNGTGTAYRVGDDAYIGDVNVANTMNVRGSQNADRGYISFGNDTTQLGRITTGALTWGGNAVFHDGYHPNADKWTTARTLSLTGDVTGSVSWDGSGNASLTATVADDSHTHDGRYYTESESNSRFTRFINDATLNSSTDTASFISELSSEFGCFAGNAVTLKCSWSYAGNSDLNTGHSTIGTIELAGCTIETWGGTYKHVRITRPNTGTGGHCVVEYNDQGSGYSPGWREIWTSESDGSGSGLDADTVDGLHASSFASASHTHSYLPLSGGTLTGTMYGTTVDVSSAVKIGSEVVLQESSDRADLLQITSTTSSWAGLQIRNSSNEGRWSLMTDGTTGGIYDDMSNAWHIQFIDGGETRLYHAGSEKLNTLSSGIYITGNLTASGNVTAYSDKKLKENIEVIPDALAKVSSLSGYTFDRVDMDIPRQTGVIAQEVQAVLPEAVTMDESGTLGVSYGNMVGLLIEAIKEQQAQIDELKSKLEGN